MPCTTDFSSYDVCIEGRTHRLWDTPGLTVASGFRLIKGFTQAAEQSLKRFLQERRRLGELDLLVFCVRRSRSADENMSRLYKMFCRPSRRMAIPVTVAITHLERVQPTMEAWWQDNERRLGTLGLVFDGHACLTCLSSHHRMWASQRNIRDLISAEYRPRAWSVVSDREYLGDSEKACAIC